MLWDVVVIGAGAAGLMAAIQAKQDPSKQVLLLDRRDQFGAKIIMSGGTRCNLTNEKVRLEDFATNEPDILKKILKTLSVKKTLQFFEEIGIEVVSEPGGKYFPATHSGRAVLGALTRFAREKEVVIQTPFRVTKISKDENVFTLASDTSELYAKTVIMTTGGLSFPTTGSDGLGDEIAKTLGHSFVKRTPSLTPLVTSKKEWKKLTGVSLPVTVSLWEKDRKLKSFTGDFLFTHFGFSGPVALNISRFWIRSGSASKRVLVSFLPGDRMHGLRETWLLESQNNPQKKVFNFLTDLLPKRLVETLFSLCQLEQDIVFSHFPKSSREKLLQQLFESDLQVMGDKGYQKAEVTAGGVDLREIDVKTMESRKCAGLFLAGEILDVDGRIGGFNFQWAWTSGRLAGLSAAK